MREGRVCEVSSRTRIFISRWKSVFFFILALGHVTDLLGFPLRWSSVLVRSSFRRSGGAAASIERGAFRLVSEKGVV